MTPKEERRRRWQADLDALDPAQLTLARMWRMAQERVPLVREAPVEALPIIRDMFYMGADACQALTTCIANKTQAQGDMIHQLRSVDFEIQEYIATHGAGTGSMRGEPKP